VVTVRERGNQKLKKWKAKDTTVCFSSASFYNSPGKFLFFFAKRRDAPLLREEPPLPHFHLQNQDKEMKIQKNNAYTPIGCGLGTSPHFQMDHAAISHQKPAQHSPVPKLYSQGINMSVPSFLFHCPPRPSKVL